MSALDKLKGGITSSGTTASTVNSVYLGVQDEASRQVASPTGGVYTIPAMKTDKVMDKTEAKNSFYSWDDKRLNQFKATLAAAGFDNVSNVTAAAMWEMAVDGASTWYANSNGARKITPEEYVMWYAKDKGLSGGNKTTTSRNVYLYDKAQVNELVTGKVNEVLGRNATADEMKHFYTVIKGMIDEGTVSTTKMVNGVSTTTQKPGFSAESAKAKIEAELKKSSPQDYQEKKSLDFADFLGQLER
jgi:hypothetical protein